MVTNSVIYNMTSDKDIDGEKRKMVWDSLLFLASQRSKSLMKLNLLRRNKNIIINEEEKTLKEARRIKNRILREVDVNIKLLSNEDKDNLGLNNKSDD